MSFSTVTVSSSRVAQVPRPVAALEPGNVGRERQPARVRVDDAGHADDDAVDPVGGQPARLGERDAQAGDRVDRALGVGAVELDVLPRADLAAQVADRAAQEARAEVEAEHEPRLGHDLEEGGAVRRPARDRARVSRTRPASSSDWSASETVGFEIPARREISAREIGAPERIASSTVRSFRSLRSGGIAALRAIVEANLTRTGGRMGNFGADLDFRGDEVQSRVSKLN